MVEAHAFLPHVTIAGTSYDMLMLIAKDVPGATQPECRIEKAADYEELVCNNTMVVPWLAAGERPRPSFKARFQCDG